MLANALIRDMDFHPLPHNLRQQGSRPTRARDAKISRCPLQALGQELLDGRRDRRWPTGVRSFKQSAPAVRQEPLQPARHSVVALASQGRNFSHGMTVR
jgi:hypothetical protein